jgi:predicted secreted protein
VVPPQPVVTQAAKEKADNAKAYIEKKYAKLKNEEKERKEGKIPWYKLK